MDPALKLIDTPELFKMLDQARAAIDASLKLMVELGIGLPKGEQAQNLTKTYVAIETELRSRGVLK
jgi:hypothetical protein